MRRVVKMKETYKLKECKVTLECHAEKDRLRILWMWAKQDYIVFKEFQYLLCFIDTLK